jgi:hypothetical protein
MGLIFTQSADNEVITVPVGTTVGTVRVTKNNVTFRGSDRDTCIIQGDATFAFVFQISGATPSTNITVENCTIDCNNNPSITGAFGTDVPDLELLTLNNVKIIGVPRGGIAIVNEASLVCNSVEIVGDGGGIQCTQDAISTDTSGGVIIRGCKFGFVVSSGYGPTVPVNLANMKIYHDYWANPTYEECEIVSVDATGVNVSSNETAHRSITDVIVLLVPTSHFVVGEEVPYIQWGRAETSDGRWAQIINGVITQWHGDGTWRPTPDPTDEYVTAYTVVLGKLWSATSQRLSTYHSSSITPYPHWRTPDGRVVPTVFAQGATVCRILRANLNSTTTRDVDTGGIHCTDSALNPVVRNCYVRGGFSDCITVRSAGTISECLVEYGQDMGYTVDGTDGSISVVNSVARGCGVHGFTFILGNSTLSRLKAYDNGIHKEYGYGVRIDDGIVATGNGIDGEDNYSGLVYGHFIQPANVVRPFRRRQ